MADIIIAYDGTPHAEDALVLGRLLAELTGGSIGLAHVHRADPRNRPPSGTVSGREAFLRREGERLLAQASTQLEGVSATRHAVAGTTTASGLRRLADSEHAQVIVFGSAYNGPVGRVHPGSATRRLLHSARCAIAVAPAGLRERELRALGTVAFTLDDDADSARRSAEALAGRSGARVSESPDGGADLLIIGSTAGTPSGRVMTGAAAEQVIQGSAGPVIVLASGTPLGTSAPAPRAVAAA
jgi:nucleotide-binding universal stress UspA family protein